VLSPDRDHDIHDMWEMQKASYHAGWFSYFGTDCRRRIFLLQGLQGVLYHVCHMVCGCPPPVFYHDLMVHFSRLPVRALLFQCSICSHGGHQTCYREYYEQHPMVDLPSSFLSLAAESNTQSALNTADDDTSSTTSMLSSMLSSTFDSSMENSPIRTSYQSNLAGHPCASGCGHFCWATNGNGDDM
jgi:hypothetical protein